MFCHYTWIIALQQLLYVRMTSVNLYKALIANTLMLNDTCNSSLFCTVSQNRLKFVWQKNVWYPLDTI